MSAGNVKVSMLLELKNKLRTGLSTAKKALATEVSQMKAKLKELKVSHIEAFKSMRDEIPGFGRAMEVLGNPYVLITAGLVALGAAFFKAQQLSAVWEKGMAKINVTAQMGKEELKDLSNQMLNIGKRNAVDLMEIPEAMNKLISAGLDKDTALRTLEPTLKAAKAGFTDIETVAAAAVNTMNSSGIMDANRVYDILFATLNKGNAEFSDIANYLPKIIPMAKSAGFSLEETAGAFAYLTAQGFKAEAAATGLQNTFKSLSTARTLFGSKTSAGFEGIGVKIFDAKGQMRSMLDIVRDLKKQMDGLNDKQRIKKFDSIGLDSEATTALLSLMDNYESLDEIIKFTQNSQGQLAEAVKNSATSGDSWIIIGNNIKAAFIGMGDTINEIFGGLGQWILDNSGLLETFAYLVGGVATAWGGYLLVANAAAIGTGILTGAQWLLNAALNANPLGLVITAIGLLIGGFVVAYKKSERFRAVLAGIIEVGKLITDVFIGLGKTILGAFTFDTAMFLEGVKQSASAATEIVNGGIAKAYKRGYDGSMQESEMAQKKQELEDKNLYPAPGTPPAGTKPTDTKKTDTGVDKVTGNSQQSRVINITIKSFIENFSSKHEEVKNMSKKELERWFQEMINRTVHSLETSYE